jgi:hypothetical protein
MSEQISLEQLEEDYWGNPPEDSPRLVRLCYDLRRKALNSLSVEEMRVMISQEIGLEYLLVLSISILENDILIAGDFHPGDLLLATLRVDSNLWLSQDLLRTRLKELLEVKINEIDLSSVNREIKNDLKAAINRFLESFK